MDQITASGRSWSLDDAQLTAERHPYTFYKPSPEAVSRLAPNDLVKLIFAFSSADPEAPRAERMWVRITARVADAFTGVLDNEPRWIRDLACGAPVEFGPRHIIQVSIDDPVPDPTEPYWPRCFVAKRVLDGEAQAGWLYREAPDDDEDSGWRILVGDETDEDMERPEMTAYVSLGAALGADDRWLALIDTPAPCAFGWDAEAGRFVAVENPVAE